MKAVIQRVQKASVSIDPQGVIGSIDLGLLVFLGVIKGDSQDTVEKLAKKLSQLRIFMDEQNKMNRSVQEVGGEILLIPNFTLGADCSHGNRPYFAFSESPQQAKPLFLGVVEALKKQLKQKVSFGQFGSAMKIQADFMGPVTIFLDTDQW